MRFGKIVAALVVTTAFSIPALAQEGAPASPSGAPAAAAESGSSEAGKPAATNEMSSHKHRAKKHHEMANPHKNGM